MNYLDQLLFFLEAEDTDGLDFHAGYRFLTYDNDDIYNNSRLAHGGWWYRSCSRCGTVNLNGQYITPGTLSHTYLENAVYREAVVFYYNFDGYVSLKETKMMFRRL